MFSSGVIGGFIDLLQEMSILRYMTKFHQNKAKNPYRPHTLWQFNYSGFQRSKFDGWMVKQNSSFAFRRDKKPKLFKNNIYFGYDFWNDIYLASHSPKNNGIALIRSAQSKIYQSICQRCYVTLKLYNWDGKNLI